MSRRSVVLVALGLILLSLLSACGGGDLAEDLTPIPTIQSGEEPELVTPLEPAVGTGEMSDAELVALGEKTFASNCAGCHGAEDATGPAFPGMAARAAERVEGLSAEEYLTQSIREPGAFVVEGFGAMSVSLSDDNLVQGLVAYILAESGEDDSMAAAEPTAEPEPTEEPTEPTAEPEPVIDAELGETLFASNCAACHRAEDGVGPAFTGMADRAAERVEGQTAEDYLIEAIVKPGVYVVDGFENIMSSNYGEQFTDADLRSIVAYILAEGAEAPSGEPADDTDMEPTEEPAASEPAGDALVGDPEAGETLFASGCAACHQSTDGAGPALPSMGERAAERVEGQTAAEYLHESIVDPAAYRVENFGDIMPKNYGEQFSDQELADLVAYILTQ